MREFLLTQMGADPAEVSLLTRMLAKERRYRFQRSLQDGMDLSSIKILVLFPIIIIAFINAAVLHHFKDNTAMATTVVLTFYSFIFLGFNGFKVLQGLLGDEDFKVIATQPLQPTSFLIAQLRDPMRESLLLYAATCLPACILGIFVLPLPVLGGLGIALIGMVYNMTLLLFLAVLITLGMRFIGLDNLRVGVSAGGLLLMMLLTLILPEGKAASQAFQAATHAQAPRWLPTTWLGSLMDPIGNEWEALAGLILLVPLPILVFRYWARHYTSLLGTSRLTAGRASGKWAEKLLTLGSKDPAVKVLAGLCLSHAREDWRFRSQALLPPILFLGLCLHHWLGSAAVVLFADPFTIATTIHPSMFLMVLIALPPVLSLPVITFSTHHRAAWILNQGIISEAAFRKAYRRMARILCVFPYIALLTVFYMIEEIPITHIIAHMFMLYLIADMLITGTQSIFKGYPFSRANGDNEIMLLFLPMVLCMEALGALFSLFIYHVVYQWWWAYLIWTALLLVIRHLVLKAQDQPAAKPKTVQKEVPKAETTPLIVAVRSGRYHTAKTLLAAGADPNRPGPDNKSAFQWAQELEDSRFEELFKGQASVTG